MNYFVLANVQYTKQSFENILKQLSPILLEKTPMEHLGIKNWKGALILKVSQDHQEIIDFIKKLVEKGFPEDALLVWQVEPVGFNIDTKVTVKMDREQGLEKK